MMYELGRSDFDRVRGLFRSLSFQPFCTVVLAGIHPGKVYVNDLDRPRTAFLTRGDMWCYLAGDPGDDAFNCNLNQALNEGQLVSEDVSVLLFTCTPDDWGGRLPVVCAPREPISQSRRHYVCRKLAYDWQSNVPDGFSVCPMDATLLDRPDLEMPDEVRGLIEGWRSKPDPRFQDYGFVAVQEGTGGLPAGVVSWATVDAIIDGVGDAGLFTLEAYRRRGLATVTAAAAVGHGLSHGLSAVSWTCGENNAGSVRTAEKLGFERGHDYTLYWLELDEG